MSSKLSRRRKNSGKTVQKSETILELDILPAKSFKSFSSPNEPIKEEIPQGNVINYTERSKYWSDKITDLLSDKSRGDIGKLLQENCKRIASLSFFSNLKVNKLLESARDQEKNAKEILLHRLQTQLGRNFLHSFHFKLFRVGNCL